MANYVLLEKIELTSATASITFANITQTGYTDLKIVCSTRSNKTGQYDEYVKLSFNGVTTNQSARILYGVNGTTAGSQTATAIYGATNADTSTSSTFGLTEFYIPNYNQAIAHSVSIEGLSEGNATASIMQLVGGLWNPGTPAAITSITLSPNEGTSWLTNSVFSLYGISASGTTPSFAPQALGGNTIKTDGTYWYHTFLSSGSFIPLGSLSCDVLVIAGGGSGGSDAGGGGGAGGLLYSSSQSLSANTTYPCLIGAGGTATPAATIGNYGSNSQFGSITASVGGGAGSTTVSPAGTGGSGGGGGRNNGQAGGSPTSGQGYAGGNGVVNTSGGGGGGAGAAGASGSGSTAGSGGAGVNTYSTWATVTNTGVSGYYAGGGGGGASTGGTAGTGGSGGGGNGGLGNPGNGASGTVNTGSGGGGGGGSFGVSTNGAAGGSGIIIVRYAV